jgi:hypothetical protein
MPFDGPFRLGPFLVDDVGGLAPRGTDHLPRFTVSWRDRTVRACLRQDSNEAPMGTLEVEVVLGRVPSTAGSDVRSRLRQREDAFSMIGFLKGGLPAGWQMLLLADHRVALERREPLDLPITAAALVCNVTLFLLALDPYLDLMDEAGMADHLIAKVPAMAAATA